MIQYIDVRILLKLRLNNNSLQWFATAHDGKGCIGLLGKIALVNEAGDHMTCRGRCKETAEQLSHHNFDT